MNRLSLRKNRLKFKTSRESRIILDVYRENIPQTNKEEKKLKDVNM